MRPCTMDGCDRPHLARGWCRTHYLRWYKHGDPTCVLTPSIPDRTIPIGQRFWSRVDFSTPDGCWLWTGSKRHFYGEVWVDGTKQYAHRAAYEMVYGPLGDAKVCHTCDTPLCVRPDHLRAGTQADNIADMAAKGRWRNQHAAGPNAEPRPA